MVIMDMILFVLVKKGLVCYAEHSKMHKVREVR